jgi:uncharacterized protein (TIGR03086 family)
VGDTRELHERSLQRFTDLVHAIRPSQWHDPTPCGEWDVRALVNHLVVEQLWVPELLAGRTVAEVGDRLDGDQLGDDPVATWDRSSADAVAAFAAPGALEREVHLSYGDVPAADYCGEMTMDATVHAWDLARGIGADDRLDPELVQRSLDLVEPRAAELEASGLFAEPVPVPADADPQTRLLAQLGRSA